jgi:hypothetical protein
MKRLLITAILVATSVSAAQTTGSRPPERWGGVVTSGVDDDQIHGKTDFSTIELTWSREHGRHDTVVRLSPSVVHQAQDWFGNGDQTVHALGLSGGVRWRLFGAYPTLQPYSSLTFGVLYGRGRIPAATSHLNFITEPELGVMFHPRGRFVWIAGARFTHSSNQGVSWRNPGRNIWSGVLGFEIH